MPAGNGTGPLGKGPMTGRGLGYCARNVQSEYAGGLWNSYPAAFSPGGRAAYPKGRENETRVAIRPTVRSGRRAGGFRRGCGRGRGSRRGWFE